MLQLLHPFRTAVTPAPSPSPPPAASRRGTFSDLPADLGLLWYHFPNTSTVHLDNNNKIEWIDNCLGSTINRARTAATDRRHYVRKVNGFDSAYSDNFDCDGILLENTAMLPQGSADRHMTFVVMPIDGIVAGYGGDGQPYRIDSPFSPGFRLHAGGNTFTSQVPSATNQMHAVSTNLRSSKSFLSINGVDGGVFDAVVNSGNNSFGIKGSDLWFYTLIGGMVSAYIGKRAATVDEQHKIDSICQQFTGKTLPADHPYATAPWMVAG